MKKKLVLGAIFYLFLNSFINAQTITIIPPSGGDVWYKGQTYAIVWTKAVSMSSKLKIRLYQDEQKF